MRTLEGKTAFVTGAASGIGLAITQALVDEGALVMMADLDFAALEQASQSIVQSNQIAITECDVASHQSMIAASYAMLDRFGCVDLLFNNAGVSLAGQNGSIPISDWRWIVDINFMGVVHGIEVFLPLIKESVESCSTSCSPSSVNEGYIVNTASMAGHAATSYMAPYNATKFAVVGYSESLREELADSNIGVSVLCPTWVQSNIYNAHGGAPSIEQSKVNFTDSPVYEMTKQLIDNGMSATQFANLTLNAIRDNRFYVFNDASTRYAIDVRRDSILADYDACLCELSALA